MRPGSVGVSLFVLAIHAAPGVPLFAQATGSSAGGGGLFAGGGDSTGRQSLRFTLSFGEAYDDDVLGDVRPTTEPNVERMSGYFTTLTLEGAYARRGSRVQLRASGTSAVRYFGYVGEMKPVAHTAGAGVQLRVSTRTQLDWDLTAAYAPSSLYHLFPAVTTSEVGGAPPSATDYGVDHLESYLYGSGLTLTHSLSARTQLTASTDAQYTDFRHASPTMRDLRSYGVRGQFSRAFARGRAFIAGYRYRSADFAYTAGASTTDHDAHVGLELGRPLSANRRATVSLTLGAARVSAPRIAGVTGPSGHHDRVRGSAAAGYQFGRSWALRTAYRSELVYMGDLAQPVYVDGVTTTLVGLLHRRLNLAVTGGYSSGESALQRNDLIFDTYTADARVQWAFTRSIAAYAQYLYFFYDFGSGASRPPRLPASLERNGARVGLTVWMSPIGR